MKLNKLRGQHGATIIIITTIIIIVTLIMALKLRDLEPGGRALPYMGYIGMCRCEGYGFQAVYSRIGYLNQSVWV